MNSEDLLATIRESDLNSQIPSSRGNSVPQVNLYDTQVESLKTISI